MKSRLTYFPCTLLTLLVALCFAPTPFTAYSRGQAQAFPRAARTPVQQPLKRPEKVKFPDMVKKTRLQDEGPKDTREIAKALKELETKEKRWFFTPGPEYNRAYRIWFREKVSHNSPYQIKSPATGNFKLVIEAAEHFEVIDADATDGQATLHLPAGVFKTYLRLPDLKDDQSQLKVEDKLYHVKDTLHHRAQNRWMLLGQRPLPVPKSWYSEDGKKLVLNLSAKDVRSFQMLWIKSDSEAPFPPGIGEIGPEGGVVELPGAARLTIPKGALTENKVLCIKQVPEAFRPITYLSRPGTTYEKVRQPYAYVSSLIELQPHGLTFKKSARIRLNNLSGFPHHSNLIKAVSMPYVPKLLISEQDFQDFTDKSKLLSPAPRQNKTLHHGKAFRFQSPSKDEEEFYIDHFSTVAEIILSKLVERRKGE